MKIKIPKLLSSGDNLDT